MTRKEAIERLQKRIIPRLWNPTDEDVQALNIAVHDIKVLENYNVEDVEDDGK